MRFDAIVFDLDGTLLNTLGDLRNAVNHALSVFSLPPRTMEEVRSFIGNGVANLIRRAMPETSTEEDLAAALTAFRAYYNDHLNVETKPYDGIVELLTDLKAAGIPVFINSNKYDAALQSLCADHFPHLYRGAAGETASVPRKPDPSAALSLIASCGAKPENCAYIGDSGVDVKTAANAGMTAVWVSWGFRSRSEMEDQLPEHCFDTVRELRDFLLGGKKQVLF